MLENYFRPKTVDRLLASWIGPLIERHAEWLTREGHARTVVLYHVAMLMHFGEFARAHGAVTWGDLPALREGFVAEQVRQRQERRCLAKRDIQNLRAKANAPVRKMLRVVLPEFAAAEDSSRHAQPWPFQDRVPGFLHYLTFERGLSPETIGQYSHHLGRFETFLREQGLTDLSELAPSLVTGYMMEHAERLSISTLGGRCGVLRVFLRYLYREKISQADLSPVVEWPRVYRLSGLPRSIRAEEVGAVLSTPDRRTPVGKRDHAILLLLVTYGLRAREVAALTFDDLDWEHDRFRVPKRKAGHSAVYPLCSAVGEALIDYIRNARPQQSTAREVFLRVLPPLQPVRHHVISQLASRALKRAGVAVPRMGSHSFRHTCVQRLVDADFPFKVIGDYVGHRHPNSTHTYGKVAIEALRAVALGDGEDVL